MNRVDLEKRGFGIWTPLRNAREVGLLPNFPGVYAVSYAGEAPLDWPVSSCGGWHKGRNPAVHPDRLRAEWVEDTDLVYIGKTDRTLAKRIGEFERFGNGEPVAHWGGRLVWQLPDPAMLTIGWLELAPGQASSAEAAMLGEFFDRYGKLPFANLRR
ncbi:hypothetical protein [Sphingopyxis sp. Root1497]|uniref:hypothetical protein n=1 Tax=Sphingopyxis sp. Root1497 TaxID=1736474 RepID=UPI0012E39199|nr:hypothetical protein [Sphingopyxis sp. Root1497]